MNGMIVDFPHKQGLIACENSVEMSTATSGQRRVSFADTSKLAVFRRAAEEELGLVSYSKAERSQFKRQFMQDIATQ